LPERAHYGAEQSLRGLYPQLPALFLPGKES
jgi:hypothetical protein